MQNANIALFQGDDYVANITVTDGSGPANLAGYTCQAQIRKDVADNATAITYDMAPTINLPNTIALRIPHAITLTLTDHYVWDLQLTAADGTIQTIIGGTVTCTREVTR